MLGGALLLGCIYVQSQFTLDWLESLPILDFGVKTHQLFDKHGHCKNYLFRVPTTDAIKSENKHIFPDPQFSISVSTNNSFGLINDFTTRVIPLPFLYNTLISRPLKQCNFLPYRRTSKHKLYYRKKRFGKELLYRRLRLYNKYFNYLISICPHSTDSSGLYSNRGLLNSLYPYRLGYLDSVDDIKDSETYFNISIINNNPIKQALPLIIRLGIAIISSAILYKFI